MRGGMSESSGIPRGVFVSAPLPGERVSSSLTVLGWSQTNEGNVHWMLEGESGQVLARGHASGGALDAAAPFEFSVQFSVDHEQIGHLIVVEPDESDGEGFPSIRNVIPVVLIPRHR